MSKITPPKLAEKLHDKQLAKDIKLRRELGDIIIPLRKPKRTADLYNYKIKFTGDLAEAKHYTEPIRVGYERKHKPTRKDNRTMANEQNTKRARQAVYDLVNTNWTPYTKMLTLTYRETMLDFDQLATDWKVFVKQMKRDGYAFPFLSIIEHQKKRGQREGNEGALHIHALLFTDTYIPFKAIKKAWGNRGSVHIEKVDKIENKGAYVAKYITKDGQTADKKSYRVSRDIKRPTYRAGLGSEIDVAIDLRSKGFEYQNQHDYTVVRGNNQETGEILEETVCTVSKYRKKRA